MRTTCTSVISLLCDCTRNYRRTNSVVSVRATYTLLLTVGGCAARHAIPHSRLLQVQQVDIVDLKARHGQVDNQTPY